MTKDYSSTGAKARNMERLVLQRFQNNGMQTRIAEETGITDTWISRFKSQQLQQACLVLAHLGLKIVDESEQTISEEKLRAFALITSDVFRNPERVVDSLKGSSDE